MANKFSILSKPFVPVITTRIERIAYPAANIYKGTLGNQNCDRMAKAVN